MNLDTFLDLLSVIGILFLLMSAGFACRKFCVIDDAASKRLSALIIKLGQPMMIVGALISKDFSISALREGLFFMLIGFLLHPLMALIAFLLAPCYTDEAERKISCFATIFTNCGFIGFPILEAIFPQKGAFIGAFFVIGFHIYVWTLGIMILGKGREDIRLTPKKAILNPGTVPCAIGLSLYLLKAVMDIPLFLVDFTNHLGNLCLPISVLITGALIAKEGLGSLFRNPRIYWYNAIKLVGMPLAVCLLVKLVTLGMTDPYNVILFCTVIAALPSGSSVAMLAQLYDIDPEYAAQTVSSSTLLAIGTLPLVYCIGDLIAKL